MEERERRGWKNRHMRDNMPCRESSAVKLAPDHTSKLDAVLVDLCFKHCWREGKRKEERREEEGKEREEKRKGGGGRERSKERSKDRKEEREREPSSCSCPARLRVQFHTHQATHTPHRTPNTTTHQQPHTPHHTHTTPHRHTHAPPRVHTTHTTHATCTHQTTEMLGYVVVRQPTVILRRKSEFLDMCLSDNRP